MVCVAKHGQSWATENKTGLRAVEKGRFCSCKFSPVFSRKGYYAGSAPWCYLFLGSPIFPMSTDLSDKVWLFLELESMAGDGKLWCCFLIWNPRHRDVAAMGQTLHSVSTGGVPPPHLSRSRAWGPMSGLPRAAGDSPGCDLVATSW